MDNTKNISFSDLVDIEKSQSVVTTPKAGEALTLENSDLRATFDTKTGLLSRLENLAQSVSLNITQQLLYYQGMAGNNSKGEFQASGAYIFRPNGTTPYDINRNPTVTMVKVSVEMKPVHKGMIPVLYMIPNNVMKWEKVSYHLRFVIPILLNNMKLTKLLTGQFFTGRQLAIY